MLGSYSWQLENVDGTTTNIIADSAHPLDCRDLLSPLETTEATAALRFSEEPGSIVDIRCWSDEHWSESGADSEAVSVNGNTMELRSGGYIYEITAQWGAVDKVTFILVWVNQKDAHRRHPVCFIIRFRFNAVADKRQWSSAASKPRRKTRTKLCSRFCAENEPSHQTCRSFSASR